MTKKRKWLSTILIILGIGIAAFPLADRLYASYWQDKLLAAYEEDLQLEIVAPELVESDYFALQAIYESEDNPELINLESDTTEALSEGASEVATESTTDKTKIADKSVIGKIKIAKIDLIMPVLLGATERNLNRGAAIIAGTSDFDEIGNVGIAGHRGRSYGIFFNRLNELAEGDVIEVTTNNKVYKYTIYKIHIVEPTDVSVLYRNDSDKILTLVTCDPIKNPTHRLIVHALQNP
jgi:sortase A